MKTRILQTLTILVTLAILISSCAPAATPAPTSAPVIQTVVVKETSPATVVTQMVTQMVTSVPAKKNVTIGYAAPGLVGGQINIQETLLRYASQKGWQVVLTNSNGDAQKQNDDIDQLISQGVDAIVSVPQDSAAICAGAAKAKAASRIVAMSFCEPRSWTRVLSS